MEPSARRKTILIACERLLHRYGPAKTTMQDIAREAQIAVGSVYLEFDSKEQILAELSSRKHSLVLEAMRRALAVDRSFVERIRAAFDARTEAFFAIADGGVHGGDLVHCAHSAVRSEHEKFKQAELAMLAAVLREGARARELDVRRPELAARAVVVAYARFAPPWLFGAPREETTALLRAMHEVVLYGLVKRQKR